MAAKIPDKLRKYIPFTGPAREGRLPQPLPADPDQQLVEVWVEGYEDVAFWRGVFDRFRSPRLRFEISVPNRADLAKGKKVLLNMIPHSSESMLLCADSDFDFLFDELTEQSRQVKSARFMFHTYAYATENYLCYAPSLHNVCVKATKNDTHIFDFERFMHEYSCTIYPLFVWYAFAAQMSPVHIFTLADFRSAVRIGYLDLENNGDNTLAWLKRNVEKRETLLRSHNGWHEGELERFEAHMRRQGLTPQNAYMFMHGHTLMDNVVMVLLETVCEKLRQMSMARITASLKQGVALKNEMSNYTNSQRSIRDVLLDNENYTDCPLYQQLLSDVEQYVNAALRES